MKVHNVRTGREVRLANPTQFVAPRADRSSRTAFAGDIIGHPRHRHFEIGDTLTGGSRFEFEGMPSFAPEHFARLALLNPI